MMILQVILEGIGLGVLLILVCAIGTRKGAVGMLHLYSPEVQGRCVKLGLTTHKNKAERFDFQSCLRPRLHRLCAGLYLSGERRAWLSCGLLQLFVILSVMNLIDRFLIDGYWGGLTKAWTIPGTEDLMPYITAKDKTKKWLFGTVGMAVISAVLAQL